MGKSSPTGHGLDCWEPRKTSPVLVEKLYDVLSRRYGLAASGATDVVAISLR